MSPVDMVVSDGLIQAGSELALHSELFFWQSALVRRKRDWYDCPDKSPMEWYSAIVGALPSELLAAGCDDIPEGIKQCWMATPYHAEAGHNSVKILPEYRFSWTPEDAKNLCKTVNSLLIDEGMEMIAVGLAMLLLCREPLLASPSGFGQISGRRLPGRPFDGPDGGRLSRLLSEIQMQLFQHPLEDRRVRGEPDVSGIWFWAPSTFPAQSPGAPDFREISVATRNPVLQSLVEGRNARLMITEAEGLAALVKQGAPLPKCLILAGEGYAVVLSKSLLPVFGKAVWKPQSVKPESELVQLLHGMFH